MVRLPADPAQAVLELAKVIDQLSGQLAAATAFIVYAPKIPVSDDDRRAMQVIAQKLAPEPIAPLTEPAPKLHASLGVELLQRLVNQRHPN